MSRLPIVADDLDNWGTILNDFLLQLHNADGTLRDETITALKINTADIAAIRTKLDIQDTSEVIALIDDLSGVTDIVTARANLSIYSQAEVASVIATAVADYLLLTGGTLTNFLTLHANPTNALHAVTKQYADTLLTSGFQIFDASGTFTVPAGVTEVLITAVAGGGGGGGGAANPDADAGAGGGAGQSIIDYSVTGLTPSADITVTVGDGGTGGASASDGTDGGDTALAGYITVNGGGKGIRGLGGAGGSTAIGTAAGVGGSGGSGAVDGTAGDEGLFGAGGVGGTESGGSPGGGGGGGSIYADGGAGGNAPAGAGSAASTNSGAGGGGGSGAGGGAGGIGAAGGSGKLIVRW